MTPRRVTVSIPASVLQTAPESHRPRRRSGRGTAAVSQVTGRRLLLPGRGTTFIREVSGPPGAPTLVLLHGLAANSRLNWRSSFDSLSRVFRVIAIDHRGHARGIRVRGHFRLADCADDVVALADTLGLEQIIPVGYSMGGPIAQLIWHRHPDRVQGLVLCATATRFAHPDRPGAALLFSWFLNLAGRVVSRRALRHRARELVLSSLLKLAGRVAPRRALQWLAREWLKDAIADPRVRTRVVAELSRTDPISVAQAGGALARFSSDEWIGDVDVPTAVVVTERDGMVPLKRQLAMAGAIPGATVHRVAGGHRVCVRRPRRFVPVLLEACSSVASRATPGGFRGSIRWIG